jgi:mannose-6-phosphate isomerase-like protein (cupin superfamily)
VELLQVSEAERIAGSSELAVSLLADVERLGVDEVRSKPSAVAPPAHIHPRHSQCFFVLDGALTFRLEDRELQAGPGTWVFVPPDVVHTFTTTSVEHAHYLDFHAPSCGLGDFVRGLQAAKTEDELRAVRAAFDQLPAPEYAAADPGLVVLRRVGGAGAGFAGTGAGNPETITDRPGRRVTLLVDADELAVTESVFGPGERGPDLHVHHHHDDAFLVVEGELTFGVRDGSLGAPAGTFVLVPSEVIHTFENKGTTDARFFNFHAPSCGFGDHLRGRHPGFDQHEPPDDGGADPASVIATRLSGWVD